MSLPSRVEASFIFTVNVLDKAKISELSDEQLLDTYIDVMVEVDAVKTFYSKGGFTPKEFQQFKDLLRYRIYVIMEFQKRKLELPSVSAFAS